MAHIGVHAWEQKILQQLLIDLHIPLDDCSYADKLENTFDYAAICESIVSFVEKHSFQLIETVAEQVAAFIKEIFAVPAITITVSKPHAIKNAKSVSITISR